MERVPSTTLQNGTLGAAARRATLSLVYIAQNLFGCVDVGTEYTATHSVKVVQALLGPICRIRISKHVAWELPADTFLFDGITLAHGRVALVGKLCCPGRIVTGIEPARRWSVVKMKVLAREKSSVLLWVALTVISVTVVNFNGGAGVHVESRDL